MSWNAAVWNDDETTELGSVWIGNIHTLNALDKILPESLRKILHRGIYYQRDLQELGDELKKLDGFTCGVGQMDRIVFGRLFIGLKDLCRTAIENDVYMEIY